MLGYSVSKALICRCLLSMNGAFLYALQHGYGFLQSIYRINQQFKILHYVQITVVKCRMLLKVFAFRNIIILWCFEPYGGYGYL